MEKLSKWLTRQMGALQLAMARFMQGRYGSDALNTALVLVAFLFFIVSLLVTHRWVKLALIVVYYIILGIAAFRTLSRNTYRRYRENCRYLQLLDRIKDREHRYYTCPRCRQIVRVPRGKGKIAITCPKCKEKFIKKT